MIKLLATDLDGTLLFPKRKIRVLSSKNKKFLREFLKNGNHLVIVSGRNYQICKRISKVVRAPIDMIGCNGLVVLKDNKFFFDDPIDHESIRNFLKDNLHAPNVVCWVFMSDRYPMILVPTRLNCITKIAVKIYLLTQFAYRDKFVFGTKHLEKLLNDKEARIYKMMAMYGIGEKKIEIARQESLKFLDAWDTEFEILWSRESVEFMKKGVNKANALKRIIDMQHIKDDEVAVVGDSGNDICLFETFENSFVMKNAPKEVKLKAKNEIEGVYCIKDYIK